MPGYFFGWDQIPDLVLHITAQTLMLAVEGCPAGNGKSSWEWRRVGTSRFKQHCCWMCNHSAAVLVPPVGLASARGMWEEELQFSGISSGQRRLPAAESGLCCAKMDARITPPHNSQISCGAQEGTITKTTRVSVGQLHF